MKFSRNRHCSEASRTSQHACVPRNTKSTYRYLCVTYARVTTGVDFIRRGKALVARYRLYSRVSSLHRIRPVDRNALHKARREEHTRTLWKREKKVRRSILYGLTFFPLATERFSLSLYLLPMHKDATLRVRTCTSAKCKEREELCCCIRDCQRHTYRRRRRSLSFDYIVQQRCKGSVLARASIQSFYVTYIIGIRRRDAYTPFEKEKMVRSEEEEREVYGKVYVSQWQMRF